MLGRFEGEFVVSGPEERGGAAPFVLTEDVHLDACPSEDTGGGLGNLLLPEGSGASCEEDHVGHFCLGDLCGPPVPTLLLVSAVGVVVLGDTDGHGLVCAERTYSFLDHPSPDGLPEFDEGDVCVADCLAVSASGALVDGVDEVGAERDFPPQGFVEGALNVDLVQVVDLSPGGNGLPRGLVVCLADSDAVTALYAGSELFLNMGDFCQ